MGKNGIITEEIREKENNAYHDIIELFKIYRSVTWQMQAKILQVKRRFQNEYGTDVDSFLESIYEAGLDLNDDDAVEVMRRYHPKGGKILLGIILYLSISPSAG